MRKIVYSKYGKNDIFAYFDKSIFDSEEHEKKFLLSALEQILGVYLFEGTVIVNCIDNDAIEQFKKYSLKYEVIEKIEKLFRKNIVLKISFDINVLKEILDVLYQYDVTFEGQAFQREESKIGIGINDNDGSFIILSNNVEKIEEYKSSFLKEISKHN